MVRKSKFYLITREIKEKTIDNSYISTSWKWIATGKKMDNVQTR